MNSRKNWDSWVLNDPLDIGSLGEEELACYSRLPSDYQEFLSRNDGGEGFIAEHYLILWRAEELAEFNRDYGVEDYAPGIFLFGSNGSGEGYGFDLRESEPAVVMVPFIGMSLQDADLVALSFTAFLHALEKTPECE